MSTTTTRGFIHGVILFGLALSSCADKGGKAMQNTTGRSEPADSDIAVPALQTADPADVGLSKTALARIAKLLEPDPEEPMLIGGMAMVIRNGKIAYFTSNGLADTQPPAPFSRDSIFRICSNTKPVTTTAVLMLAEKGKLSLSDPLSKYLPEFASPAVLECAQRGNGEPKCTERPAAREITIRDLLTHTSGFGYSTGYTLEDTSSVRLAELYRKHGITGSDVRTERSLAEQVKKLAELPLTRDPGSGFRYGLSSVVLGRVVEKVSGTPFDDFVTDQILKPLGMNDTYFKVPQAKAGRLSTRIADELSFPDGGSGLWTTVDDFARFVSMLDNGGQLGDVRLLSQGSVTEMTSNQIGDFAPFFSTLGNGFGYGVGVIKDADADPGPASTGTFANVGARLNDCVWPLTAGDDAPTELSYFFVDPKVRLVGILFAQVYQDFTWEVVELFQDHVYDSLEQ